MPNIRSLEQSHAPVAGKKIQVFVALFMSGQPLTEFAAQTLTVDVAGAAKGATSIPLSGALTSPVNAGQYLTFADANDVEKLAQVTAFADVGETSLTVAALDEAIDAADVSQYPPYLWDRTDASINRSIAYDTVETFNTGGNEDGTPGTTTGSLTLPGLEYHYNAAARTLEYAVQNSEFVYFRYEKPIPSSAFLAGEVVEGRAGVESFDSAAPAAGAVTNDFTLKTLGALNIVAATPTA